MDPRPRPDGKLDHNAALTSPDLVDFVDRQLFPHLTDLKQSLRGRAFAGEL